MEENKETNSIQENEQPKASRQKWEATFSAAEREQVLVQINEGRVNGFTHADIHRGLEQKWNRKISTSTYFRLRTAAAKDMAEELEEPKQELKARILAEKRNLLKMAAVMAKAANTPQAIMAVNKVQDSQIKLYQTLGLIPRTGYDLEIKGDMTQVLAEIVKEEGAANVNTTNNPDGTKKNTDKSTA